MALVRVDVNVGVTGGELDSCLKSCAVEEWAPGKNRESIRVSRIKRPIAICKLMLGFIVAPVSY
jgi:hypothetical protein